MSDARPTTGDVLEGRYRLAECVGRGGMADVYAADDLRRDCRVAVKLFREGLAEAVDPNRTSRELRILSGIRAPTIVEVFAASPAGAAHPYLVMELVPGDNLGNLIASGPLPAERVRRIGVDIATALAALHGRKLLHRDVKPANILVLADDIPTAAKLADFGIALAIDDARLTATNSVLGTAAYLSPEQVRGASVGPASDVYALGLVLMEAMSGIRAFGGSLAETAVARLTRAPALPTDASAELAALLMRMTGRDPADRPAAGDVATALADLIGGMTAAAPRAEPPVLSPTLVLPLPAALTERLERLPEPPRRHIRPRIGAVLIAAAVLVAVLAGGGALVTSGFARPATVEAAGTAAAPEPVVPPTVAPVSSALPRAAKTTTAPPTSGAGRAAVSKHFGDRIAAELRHVRDAVTSFTRHAAGGIAHGVTKSVGTLLGALGD